MSVIIPPGFAQAAITVIGSPGTQPYVTTFGVKLEDLGTGGFENAANSAYYSYVDAFQQATSNALTIAGCTLTIGQDGGSGSVTFTSSQQGDNNGDMEPTSMSPVLVKGTGTLGRTGRGRMFLPTGIAKDGTEENGQLTSARQDYFSAQAAQFLEELADPTERQPGSGDAVIPMYLLHSGPSAPTLVTSLTCSALVGWIRGRIH